METSAAHGSLRCGFLDKNLSLSVNFVLSNIRAYSAATAMILAFLRTSKLGRKTVSQT